MISLPVSHGTTIRLDLAPVEGGHEVLRLQAIIQSMCLVGRTIHTHRIRGDRPSRDDLRRFRRDPLNATNDTLRCLIAAVNSVEYVRRQQRLSMGTYLAATALVREARKVRDQIMHTDATWTIADGTDSLEGVVDDLPVRAHRRRVRDGARLDRGCSLRLRAGGRGHLERRARRDDGRRGPWEGDGGVGHAAREWTDDGCAGCLAQQTGESMWTRADAGRWLSGINPRSAIFPCTFRRHLAAACTARSRSPQSGQIPSSVATRAVAGQTMHLIAEVYASATAERGRYMCP